MERHDITIRNRDLYAAQIGLSIISAAKRGKCDLYGTFKFTLSTIRLAVDKAIETLNNARRELRDSHAKRDGRNQPQTTQVNPADPNQQTVILADPLAHERDERQLLDAEVTLSVPRLKVADVLALEFSEVTGDYSGALMFIEDETAKKEPERTEA